MTQLDEIEKILERIKYAVDHSASTDVDKKHIHELIDLIYMKTGEVRGKVDDLANTH